MRKEPGEGNRGKFLEQVRYSAKLNLKKFENFYKPERQLDAEGSYVALLGYSDLKQYFGIRTDYPNDVHLLQTTFDKFRRDRDLLLEAKAPTVLLPVEIFVDLRVLETQGKPRIWRIFEAVEYILYCPYYLTPVHLTRRHFIKHFHENEVLKILQDMLDLIRHLLSRGFRLNFLQFYVVFAENRYKFMICSMIQVEEPSRDLDAQLKFGAFVLYGLLKEMIFAFYNTKENSLEALISLGEERKLDRFVHAFSIFSEILARDSNNEEHVAELEQLVLRLLNDYLSTLYVFKNKEIFLLNQPVFRYIKRLHIEVNSSVDKISSVLEFVARTLGEKECLSLLFLKLSECLMTPLEAIKVIRSLQSTRSLEYLLLDFSHNCIDDTVVSELRGLNLRGLKSFRADFSGTSVTAAGWETLLLIVSELSPSLKHLTIELLQREKPFVIGPGPLLSAFSNKINLMTLKLNFSYHPILGPAFSELAEVLAHISSIFIVDLTFYQCELDDSKLLRLFVSLAGRPSIEILNLNFARNYCTDESVKGLLSLLEEHLNRIVELELQIYGNSISTQSMEDLVDQLGRMSQLKKLTLSILEHENEEFDESNRIILEKFNQLPVPEKKII